MTRDRLLLTLELVAGAFGVAAMLGILYALMRGSDYPELLFRRHVSIWPFIRC